MPLIIRIAACALLLTLMHCAEELPSDVSLSDPPAQRFASISLTYSERHRAPGASPPRVIVNGIFARHSEITKDAVIRALNLAETVSGHVQTLPIGTCEMTVTDYSTPPVQVLNTSFVDLIDAGELHIRMDNIHKQMRRRSFPDIYPWASGVTYDGTLPNLRTSNSLGNVVVESPGNEASDGFAARISAPPIPRLLEVGGNHITSNYASIDWNAELEIAWHVQDPNPAADPVFIEIKVVRLNQSASLNCRYPDKGHATIHLGELASWAEQTNAAGTTRLVVRRLANTPFVAPTFQTGELTFVSYDSVILQ